MSRFAGHMVGGVFQGANNSNFTGAVTLFTINATPPEGTLTSQPIADTNTYRYVRYLGPSNGYCNVAEVEFRGYAPAAPPLSAFAQWQMQYFNCTNCPAAAPDADGDGDGMSNQNEFMAGTSPTNSASAFRIISVEPQGDNMLLTWRTAAGKTNAVQAVSGNYSTNYTDISAPILVTGSMTNYFDAGAATNGLPRYYRIRLVP